MNTTHDPKLKAAVAAATTARALDTGDPWTLDDRLAAIRRRHVDEET